MKKCILNISSGSWYPRGQERQRNALDAVGFAGDKLYWTNSYPTGCPPHSQLPYAFKPYAFKEAQRKGYDCALWMDSAVWPIKSVDFYFEEIAKEGHILIENGWTTGHWCKDAALPNLGITREESFHIPHLMACVMGLNLKHERSIRFLDKWFALANDGVTFPGPWTNANGEASADKRVLGHRHDQTAAGVISYQMGMTWMSGVDAKLLYYDNRPMDKVSEEVILLTQGM